MKVQSWFEVDRSFAQSKLTRTEHLCPIQSNCGPAFSSDPQNQKFRTLKGVASHKCRYIKPCVHPKRDKRKLGECA